MWLIQATHPSSCFPSVQQMSRLAVLWLCWQADHTQSYYSAVFSSYVTTTGTWGRTNIKPQDPGEPKEPFDLVPHLPFLLFNIPHPAPVSPLLLLFLDYPNTQLFLPFLIILSFPMSLLYFSLNSFAFPPLLLLLRFSYLSNQISNLFSRTPVFTPNFCLFNHGAWLAPPPGLIAPPQRQIPEL